MATAATQIHRSTRPAQAGREPFKVKDLSLAEFGRNEIRLAEHEMPGPDGAAQAVRRAEAAGRRAGSWARCT